MEIRALTQSEQKYTYAQSMQLEGQTGCIGHLRGDFAPSGYGFYTSWFDTREQWKTDEFKAGLDEVINSLREDKGAKAALWFFLWAGQRPMPCFAGRCWGLCGIRPPMPQDGFWMKLKCQGHGMYSGFFRWCS